MKKWKSVLLLEIGCFFGLLINGVYAEEDEKVYTMETVVVTGTRTAQGVERIPANISVIDAEDIRNSNGKNVVDLLRSEEGIVVRDLLGTGKNAQVDLRGFGETGPFNTLVMVDGRRVNEIDLSGVDWTQIPLEQIERIEVLRGTGSVLYGDNAVGGVINIITKIPSEKPSLAVGGILGSYDRKKGQVSMSGGKDNLAASLYASYDSSDGYRDNNEFKTKDVGGKIIFDPTEFLSFNLNGSYHSDDFDLPGPLTEEEVDEDRKNSTRPDDDGESNDGYVKMGFEVDFGSYGSLVTDVSYRKRENEARFVSSNSKTKNDIKTWAFTPRFVWDGSIFNHENTLIAGVDFYWTDQDGKSYFGDPLETSGLTDIERDSYGFYFNNEFHLMDNLVLSLGARSEKVKYDLNQKDLAFGFASLDDSESSRENAYSAGLTYLYSGKSSVFVRANRSFRFPLTDELVLFDFFNGEIVVNPDLDPQFGHHYELGVRHYFTPDIQINMTLFHAEIKDEIFFNSATFANENHPETVHKGVEMGAKVNILKSITILGNYTYTKATFEKEPFKNNDIPAVPRNKVNLGIRIHDFLPGLVFSADYNYVSDSFAVGDAENEFEELDDYYTVDTRVSYQWKKLKAFFGVNNITDQDYSEYAVIGGFPATLNFYPAPERNYLGGLEVAF